MTMIHTSLTRARISYPQGENALAPDDIIRLYSKLVRRIAWQVFSGMTTALEIEDLIQIGMVALINAAANFEERGIAFEPYARTRVRGAMIDELRRAARIDRSLMEWRRSFNAARRKLENGLMRAPSDCELAAELNISVDHFHSLSQAMEAANYTSIDDVYTDNDSLFADTEIGADLKYESEETRNRLVEAISKLGDREAIILQLYFFEELNLDEIGQTLGLKAARVCQIKKEALIKLKLSLSNFELTF
jgi:RNA polymerase sigma factor FliA